MVWGSAITRASARFTRATSATWSSTDRKRCTTTTAVAAAVGLVVVATSGTQPPDGVITESAITGAAYSVNHAIIYKATGATGVSWLDAFPEGYSCGVCVPASSGFDSFAPTSCTTVEVVQSAQDGCNWT